MDRRETIVQLERLFQQVCSLLGVNYRVRLLGHRYTLKEMIDMIDEPNRSAIHRFVAANERTLKDPQGSTNNHQAWPGGWWDHITDVMNYAVLFYRVDPRPFPFSLSDLLLVLFMHDIEKPWKYVEKDGQLHHVEGMETKADHQRFRMQVAQHWGFELTDVHVNGIKYAEGELNDYSPRHRVSTELAGAAHACDHWSARVRHNYPLAENDEWHGAVRISAANTARTETFVRAWCDGDENNRHIDCACRRDA